MASDEKKGIEKSKVISFQVYRDLRAYHDRDYETMVKGMSKIELLEEMVKFQEERSRVGHLTPGMMVRGQVLFTALEVCAETEELKILTRSYKRHLAHELEAYKASKSQ